MNKWIMASIGLANGHGYLDKLFLVYPILTNPERQLPQGIDEEIRELVEKKDKVELIRTLIQLEKFPVENPYIGSLREDDRLINRNPEVVDRIGEELLSIGANGIVKGSRTPKKGSRQLGSIFQKWLPNLGYEILDGEDFVECPGATFLKGSDTSRKIYANEKLKCNLVEKGLDLLIKIGGKFVIGQAKFITTSGGAQDNQFEEATRFVSNNEGNAIRIAILDGVVWFNSRYLEKIKSVNRSILSVLLLKDFIESLS